MNNETLIPHLGVITDIRVDTPDVKGNPSTIWVLDSNGNMVEKPADEYFGLLSQDYANENTAEHGRSR